MSTGEQVRDLPFMSNDMTESLATTGKNLDTADAPGRADTELGEDDLPEAIAQTR